MAQNSQKLIAKLLILLLALAIIISLAEAKKLKKTKMSLYIQDYSTGPNSTVAAIAGIAGKHWTATQFGTLYITDDLITKTADPNSAQIGRSQGMYVTSGLDGRTLHVSISVVFTGKKYAGSTLELQGAYKHFEHNSEVSVVSGTGKFRFARGYATFETYSWNTTTGHAILRWNITVLHYTKMY
ncbi:Disease resistance response protein [Parasponia andersonii]|uniref:Dirigent protein n=1 Tax=Parasponia andersonii TaxID=3476 RepID=A0A2P5A680_PARAD|nr:Disease resistance response protein [Parasponia andersonii]